MLIKLETRRACKLRSLCKMAAGWTTAATTALLGMCGEENVQGQLDSVKRNRSIYEKFHPSCLNKAISIVGSSAELK